MDEYNRILIERNEKRTMNRHSRQRWKRVLKLFCILTALGFLILYLRVARRDTCDRCNEHEFRPLLRPPDDFCSPPPENGDKLLLLILVHSRPTSVEKRDAIRQTWAAPEKQKQRRFKVLFVFGDVQHHQQRRQKQQQQRPENDLQTALATESRRFGDILQTDFLDTYANVTMKALSGLDFATRQRESASSSCRDAFYYVAKVDDDVFFNIDNVAKYLIEKRSRWRRFSDSKIQNAVNNDGKSNNNNSNNNRAEEMFVGGQCDWHMPRRTPGDKWFVGPLEYPHISYPTYCHGFTIIYSMNAAARIYQTSKNVPFYRFDDVYLTGLVGTRQLGLIPTDIYGIFINGAPTSTCFRKNVMLSEHGEGGKKLIADWLEVQKSDCDTGKSGNAKGS